jgi:hypothetical protein
MRDRLLWLELWHSNKETGLPGDEGVGKRVRSCKLPEIVNPIHLGTRR